MSEKKRVIVLEELAPEGIERLRGEGLEVEDGSGWDAGELLRRMSGCHGLIAGTARAVSAELLRAAGDLQVVGRTGSSVDGIDVAEATRRGVIVVDTPQSNAISAAEQALALVLACASSAWHRRASSTRRRGCGRSRAARWRRRRWPCAKAT